MRVLLDRLVDMRSTVRRMWRGSQSLRRRFRIPGAPGGVQTTKGSAGVTPADPVERVTGIEPA
ncbi:hypothetical protein GS4_20_01130 [Gordonia soli NBRC 108243]|uniref:Uncharacterized protein n=1 Tax=Gordonia soli NBRC 108243 TaxID=1223545 RepID=M0QKG2_9ACTN|nr:hypothetical protein GS4_20_01130 [Gordonia soli NBRC 108243]